MVGRWGDSIVGGGPLFITIDGRGNKINGDAVLMALTDLLGCSVNGGITVISYSTARHDLFGLERQSVRVIRVGGGCVILLRRRELEKYEVCPVERTGPRGTHRITKRLTTGTSFSVIFVSLPKSVSVSNILRAVFGISCMLAPVTTSGFIVSDDFIFTGDIVGYTRGQGGVPLGSIFLF